MHPISSRPCQAHTRHGSQRRLSVRVTIGCQCSGVAAFCVRRHEEVHRHSDMPAFASHDCRRFMALRALLAPSSRDCATPLRWLYKRCCRHSPCQVHSEQRSPGDHSSFRGGSHRPPATIYKSFEGIHRRPCRLTRTRPSREHSATSPYQPFSLEGGYLLLTRWMAAQMLGAGRAMALRACVASSSPAHGVCHLQRMD